MILCSHFRMTDTAVRESIARNKEAIAAEKTLARTAGLVFRDIRGEKDTRGPPCPRPCLKTIAGLIQEAGYFRELPADKPAGTGCSGGCGACTIPALNL